MTSKEATKIQEPLGLDEFSLQQTSMSIQEERPTLHHSFQSTRDSQKSGTIVHLTGQGSDSSSSSVGQSQDSSISLFRASREGKEEEDAHREINPNHQPERTVPALSDVGSDFSHMGTSILVHASHHQHQQKQQHGSEYGTLQALQQQKRPSERDHLIRSGSDRLLGARSGREALLGVVGDRRNEFFTLKRYIFMTLGMPGTPAVTRRMQRISTCLAIPFYILLFIWGIAIFVIAMQSDGWIWKGVCPPIVPAKVMTMLAGLFFVLLGLYWLYCLWWSRDCADPLPVQQRSFSSMALLWWGLGAYFFGVGSALAAEVYEKSHLVVTLGNATSQDYPSMTTPCLGGASGGWWYSQEEQLLEVPNNMVPLWALCSMGMLWAVYLLVFLLATVSIYSV